MELHQIRYFLALSDCLNFTGAADLCGVTQPALSRAIKKLEDELGGDLFRRERNLTHITELGRLVLPLLRQCHDSALAASDLAESFRTGAHAPLRLTLSNTIHVQVVVAPLRELVANLPGLELKLTRCSRDELAASLRTGASEVGIAAQMPITWERLDSWPLFVERFDLVVPVDHPLTRIGRVSADELRGWRLFGRVHCETAEDFAATMSSHGISIEHNDNVASDADLCALIEAGVGVGLLPRSSVTSPNLCALAFAEPSLERTVSLYTVSGRQLAPAAAGLIKLLRAADWQPFTTLAS
ncbi:MAG: LysR family transcriptional regulator [Hyphomicrobiaceae bacterium]|nr:LysR family transcriptional regulator [Hyphomicrobiaceae bacterium]